jgi:hypothetical protein
MNIIFISIVYSLRYGLILDPFLKHLFPSAHPVPPSASRYNGTFSVTAFRRKEAPCFPVSG